MPRKPFIPASARHDIVGRRLRVSVDKIVRDVVARGIATAEPQKRDGKQGALDGTPDFAFGAQIGKTGPQLPDIPMEKFTEKSTDKAQNPDKPKDGKEMKEAKEGGEKGKDAKDQDEGGKPGGTENVEFGYLRYGRPELLDGQQLASAVVAHSARGLAKGPIV
jgi:hypothetical protein